MLCVHPQAVLAGQHYACASSRLCEDRLLSVCPRVQDGGDMQED